MLTDFHAGHASPVHCTLHAAIPGTGTVNHFDNPDQNYRGDFQYGIAQMDFTADTTQFHLESAPLDTSTTDGAQIGFESNGSFY